MASTFTAPDPIPSRPDSRPATYIRLKPAGTLRTWYDWRSVAATPSPRDTICEPSALAAGYVPSSFRNVASRSAGCAGDASGLVRSDVYAEYKSVTPKITAIAEVETYPAINAPLSAPTVVAISRNMPTRMFEYPSRKYAAAAPDDVAITDTSDAPIA